MKTIKQTFLLIPFLVACAKVDFIPSEVLDQGSSSTDSSKVLNYEVEPANKQVDFLLIIDDSNSMLQDQKKLASRLTGFVQSLETSEIDWQMCITTTRGLPINGVEKYGQPLNWVSYNPGAGVPLHVLKKGQADVLQLNDIFMKTMLSVGVGNENSGDERGIKAAYQNFASQYGCYRNKAAISAILISDEDERSFGGDRSLMKPVEPESFWKELEVEDYPANLVQHAHSVFGADLRFTFNSIIVKPGDKACEAVQDLENSPSHPGNLYAQLSSLTGGGVGSICDADYTNNLNTFKDKIVNSISKVALECIPDPKTLVVKINKVPVKNFEVQQRLIKFPEALKERTKIEVTYQCLNN